jgi:hypothetical protein
MRKLARRALELVHLLAQVGRLAADEDRDRLRERVQKARERLDERRLLLDASQREARPGRSQKQPEALAAGKLDQPRAKDAAHRQVDRGQRGRGRRTGKRHRQALRCEHAPARLGEEAPSGKREPVTGETIPLAERERRPNERYGRRRRGGERERKLRADEREEAVGDDRRRREDRELARGQAEGEPVLELDVRGEADALDQVRAAFPARATM